MATINGINIGGGEVSYRFITEPTTLSAGLRQVMNDIYIISTYNISTYNATYSIGDLVVYNNAMLSILEVSYITGLLNIEGDFSVGI